MSLNSKNLSPLNPLTLIDFILFRGLNVWSSKLFELLILLFEPIEDISTVDG